MLRCPQTDFGRKVRQSEKLVLRRENRVCLNDTEHDVGLGQIPAYWCRRSGRAWKSGDAINSAEARTPAVGGRLTLSRA